MCLITLMGVVSLYVNVFSRVQMVGVVTLIIHFTHQVTYADLSFYGRCFLRIRELAYQKKNLQET